MSRNINNTKTQRQCFKCKEIKPLSPDYFHRDSSRGSGFDYKCKICDMPRVNKHNRPWSKFTLNQKVRHKMLGYLRTDMKRDMKNDLSEEFVIEQLSMPCTYCGFQSTSLDRIDNNIGHIKANCVPCCTECNLARNNHFSHEEMKYIGESIKNVKLGRVNNELP